MLERSILFHTLLPMDHLFCLKGLPNNSNSPCPLQRLDYMTSSPRWSGQDHSGRG